MTYKISELASFDIDLIIDYTVTKFGIEAMVKYHDSLETCFEMLSKNPNIGLQSNFIRENYCRFNHQSYVIFYQILKNGILIIRVLHRSMDVDTQLN